MATKLPTGQVKYGTHNKLTLTDGEICYGRKYEMPGGMTGRVTNIQMMWGNTWKTRDKLSFLVWLKDENGRGNQFEFQECGTSTNT